MNPSHGITLPPQSIIGWVAGRPVRIIAGGSEPAGDPAAPPAPAAAPPTPPTPADPAAPAATAPPTPPVPPPAAGERVEDLPEWAQKLVSDARAEAGKTRTAAKEQAAKEARDGLLKQLGLKPDGSEDVDPAKLAQDIADRDLELWNLRVQVALTAACQRNGADEDLIKGVLAYEGSVDDLDPAAADFNEKLDAIVKAKVASNPKLKAAAQAAGVSGGQFAGGTGERPARPTSLGDAIRRSLTP